MPSQDSSVLKRKCHMKLCYMPHTKVVLWYFTWFGCEPPDRQVCLALSVQEPSFRCRGLAGSSPSARLGWSRTSHRSQIPRSTPWINKDLQTFESQPRYWFSVVVEVRLSKSKLNQVEKGTWGKFIPGILLKPVGDRSIKPTPLVLQSTKTYLNLKFVHFHLFNLNSFFPGWTT